MTSESTNRPIMGSGSSGNGHHDMPEQDTTLGYGVAELRALAQEGIHSGRSRLGSMEAVKSEARGRQRHRG